MALVNSPASRLGIICRHCRQKTPQVFPGRCCEAVCKLFRQETVQGTFQLVQLLLSAVADHPEGMGEVQAEQLHEGVCIDLVVIIPDQHRIRAGSSKGNELLNILDAAQSDPKFPHKSIPLLLYKVALFVYNEK